MEYRFPPPGPDFGNDYRPNPSFADRPNPSFADRPGPSFAASAEAVASSGSDTDRDAFLPRRRRNSAARARSTQPTMEHRFPRPGPDFAYGYHPNPSFAASAEAVASSGSDTDRDPDVFLPRLPLRRRRNSTARPARNRTGDRLTRRTQAFVDAANTLDDLMTILRRLLDVLNARGQEHPYHSLSGAYTQARERGERARERGFRSAHWNQRAEDGYALFSAGVRIMEGWEGRNWGWHGTQGSDLMRLIYEEVRKVVHAMRRAVAVHAQRPAQ